MAAVTRLLFRTSKRALRRRSCKQELTMSRETRLFLGNPGTGKSTIINCLVGSMVFQSGSIWGGSLTRDFQRFEADGITYMDTPGLADASIINSAAQAVTTALRQAGTYKLFFMVRLENGRVVPQDLATMERILDSIELTTVDFSVVLNNISESVYNTLAARGREYDAVESLINCGKYATTSICLIPTLSALVNVPNKVVTLPKEVLNFFETKAPICVVNDSNVKSINTDNFEQQTLNLRDMLEVMYRGHSATLDRIGERDDQQVRIDVSELPQYPVAHVVELEHVPSAPATPYIVETCRPTAPPALAAPYAGEIRQPVPANHNVVTPRQPAAPSAPYHAHRPQPETNNDDCNDCLGCTVCCLLLGPLGICCYFLFFKDKNNR